MGDFKIVDMPGHSQLWAVYQFISNIWVIGTENKPQVFEFTMEIIIEFNAHQSKP